MTFTVEFEVRDYECDLQGIVNNSVYQNYYEHARHKFLQANNVNFKEVTNLGVYLVMFRAEIDYLSSLTSNDKFHVTVVYKQISRLKCVFEQQIILSDKIASTAKFYAVALDQNKKPIKLDNILDL